MILIEDERKNKEKDYLSEKQDQRLCIIHRKRMIFKKVRPSFFFNRLHRSHCGTFSRASLFAFWASLYILLNRSSTWAKIDSGGNKSIFSADIPSLYAR